MQCPSVHNVRLELMKVYHFLLVFTMLKSWYQRLYVSSEGENDHVSYFPSRKFEQFVSNYDDLFDLPNMQVFGYSGGG